MLSKSYVPERHPEAINLTAVYHLMWSRQHHKNSNVEHAATHPPTPIAGTCVSVHALRNTPVPVVGERA